MRPQDRTRAIIETRLELSLRMVLVVIADRMSDERLTCWPSVETIAAGAGLCERHARDVLDDLEQRGLIRRWSGEHKSRDIEIRWDALADAKPIPTARGGKRPAKTATRPAKTAGEAAKTAGDSTGKDCHSDRQSLPPEPAKTATLTGKDCPRSDHEATIEATSEAPNARAPADPAAGMERPAPRKPRRPDTDSPEVLVAPADLDFASLVDRAGNRTDLANALAASGIETVAELAGMTWEAVSRRKGVGPQRADDIDKHLKRRTGEGLSRIPTPRPGAPPGRPSASGLLDVFGEVYRESQLQPSELPCSTQQNHSPSRPSLPRSAS